MKKNKLLQFGLALLTTAFIGCSKSDDIATVDNNAKFTFGESVNRAFLGTIVDANNNPLSNVTVTLNGTSVTTDSEGKFTLSNVTVKENFAYITATKNGYFKGSRVVYPHDGLNSVFIMMCPETLAGIINSGQAATVALPNGPRVAFDGAFVKEDGTTYNGSVRVYMNNLSAADANVFYKMPGNLLAYNKSGDIVGLETFGMLTVEMKGTNNEKLQLTTGHQATITAPIANNQLSYAPATIPMWHFNETSGMWEEEGEGSRVGSNYVGKVSHFSCWNYDSAWDNAVLKVIATNFDGTPVKGVRITLTTPSRIGSVLIDLGTTNTNGTLTAGVPRNEELVFRAYTPEGSLISEQTLPASPLRTRTVTVNIPAPNKN